MMTCGGGRSVWAATAPAIIVSAFAATAARADDIKVGRFWQRRVSVETVQDGKIHYTDKVGSERSADLAKVTAINVSAYADLAKAHEAIQRGDDAAALGLLRRVKPRQDWLAHWIAFQRMGALDRLNRPTEAVLAYLELAGKGADAFYLGRPPQKAVESASDAQKRDLHGRLQNALPKLRGDARTGVEAMLEAIGPIREPEPPAAQTATAARPRPTEPATSQSAPTAAAAPAPPMPRSAANSAPSPNTGAAAVTLARVIPRDDPVTNLLEAGRFREAIEMAQRGLRADDAARVNLRWYQSGMARLGLAEDEDDPDRATSLYKSAGLDFMRVVVFFPASRTRAPSLVEAGYVQYKIGRHGRARRLYEQAAVGKRALSRQTEPEYAARLEKLVGLLDEKP
jgi:tetratricopeptide (TPR) repeat protein